MSAEEEKRLYITPKELCLIARRGFSIPVGRTISDDTPSISASTPHPYLSGEILSLSVFLTGCELSSDTVTLIYPTSGRKKPRKDEVELSRGEGFLLCHIANTLYGREHSLRIIYRTSDGEVIADSTEHPTSDAALTFFGKCLSALSIYGGATVERQTERLPSFRALKFPYENVREGQRELVRSAYRAIAKGTTLFASAPTGTGKTVSVLYPALRALGDGRCDKVFYLTPKSTTAEAAKDCLELFLASGAKSRATILTAKEKACDENMLCKAPEGCRRELSVGMGEGVRRLFELNKTVIESSDVQRVAKDLSLCPYELSLCYSEICDVVICDFNYVFDPAVYLRRYFTEGGRYALLIDEAHNLPDRAREMFSAEISTEELGVLCESELLGEHSALRGALCDAKESIFNLFLPYIRDEIRTGADGKAVGATHLSDIPHELYGILDTLLAEADKARLAARRATDKEAHERERLISEVYFNLRQLVDTAYRFDSGYRLFVFLEGENMTVKLFCLDTGAAISGKLELCGGAVFFSATLTPLDYYASLLGGDGASDTLVAHSPFDTSQLSVSIVDKISTRYSEREHTMPAVCRTIASTMSARKGHYMVFAPSFEYCEAIYKAFSEKYPKIRSILQQKNMTYRERQEFLLEFHRHPDEYLVGFSVMGGIYSEGVDLAGDSLIGAVVVGIGMPSISYEREAMREYYEDRYEAGAQYAYLFPGMNRVFQAAGRVIRREDDRGVIVLIDDRFGDPIYKKSIPSLWKKMRYVGDAKELKERILAFWREVDEENS